MKKALEILESNLESLIMARNGYFEDIDYDQVEIEITKTEEAIRELVIFKNRSCGNCKYFTECDDDFNYCDKESRLNGFIYSAFCCNKWEKK